MLLFDFKKEKMENRTHPHPLALIAGSKSEEFTQKIASHLPEGVKIFKRTIEEFPNGEIGVELKETVRGYVVFIVLSVLPGRINDSIMEFLLLADALKRAGSKEIYLLVNNFPYARQERRERNKKNRHKRRPISARIVANLFSMKAQGVITFDLHAEAIQGFFDNILFENINPFKIFSDYLYENQIVKKKYLEEEFPPVLVAPDSGSSKKVSDYAELLHLDHIIVHKNRLNGHETNVVRVIGDPAGRVCIIIDDICATGGTLIGAKNALLEKGASKVVVMITHLETRSDADIEKLAGAGFHEIIITDSVNIPEKLKDFPVFKILSLSLMTSRVILNIYNDESLEAVVFDE